MPVTINHLLQWKKQREKFAVLTAYDYTMAKLVARSGVQVILVGDSLGQVILGHRTTLPVTIDNMIHHAAAVTRGAGDCLVIADMPFMSYQVSVQEAVYNAGRLIKEGGAHAVKVEGGQKMADVVAAIVRSGIAVIGHVGLTPQSVHQMGYKTQAVTAAGEQMLLSDAKAIEKAGAFAVVIEKVAAKAAKKVTKALTVPVIGCGSGPDCDGQVLVTYDLLGLFDDYIPSFVKQYADLGKSAVTAMESFAAEVKNGIFPERKSLLARKNRGQNGGKKK